MTKTTMKLISNLEAYSGVKHIGKLSREKIRKVYQTLQGLSKGTPIEEYFGKQFDVFYKLENSLLFFIKDEFFKPIEGDLRRSEIENNSLDSEFFINSVLGSHTLITYAHSSSSYSYNIKNTSHINSHLGVKSYNFGNKLGPFIYKNVLHNKEKDFEVIVGRLGVAEVSSMGIEEIQGYKMYMILGVKEINKRSIECFPIRKLKNGTEKLEIPLTNNMTSFSEFIATGMGATGIKLQNLISDFDARLLIAVDIIEFLSTNYSSIFNSSNRKLLLYQDVCNGTKKALNDRYRHNPNYKDVTIKVKCENVNTRGGKSRRKSKISNIYYFNLMRNKIEPNEKYHGFSGYFTHSKNNNIRKYWSYQNIVALENMVELKNYDKFFFVGSNVSSIFREAQDVFSITTDILGSIKFLDSSDIADSLSPDVSNNFKKKMQVGPLNWSDVLLDKVLVDFFEKYEWIFYTDIKKRMFDLNEIWSYSKERKFLMDALLKLECSDGERSLILELYSMLIGLFLLMNNNKVVVNSKYPRESSDEYIRYHFSNQFVSRNNTDIILRSFENVISDVTKFSTNEVLSHLENCAYDPNKDKDKTWTSCNPDEAQSLIDNFESNLSKPTNSLLNAGESKKELEVPIVPSDLLKGVPKNENLGVESVSTDSSSVENKGNHQGHKFGGKSSDDKAIDDSGVSTTVAVSQDNNSSNMNNIVVDEPQSDKESVKGTYGKLVSLLNALGSNKDIGIALGELLKADLNKADLIRLYIEFRAMKFVEGNEDIQSYLTDMENLKKQLNNV